MVFNDKAYAEEYERRMLEEGYPGILINKILEKTASINTIIDIGAGTGLLSIPLAENGKNVLAIEPSEEMIALFLKKIHPGIKDSIRIEKASWEKWDGTNLDCGISLHSLYSIQPLKEALAKMINKSNQRIVIVKNDFGRKTLSENLKKMLHISMQKTITAYDVRKSLNELNVAFTEDTVYQKRTRTIVDINMEAQLFKRANIEHQLPIESILKALEKLLVREKGVYVFESIYKDSIFDF